MAISDIMGLLGRAGESIGGGTSGIYGGLLSEDELRAAKNRASTKALFDLSAAMSEAGRPQSGRPMSTFGALAKGLSAAQEGYQGTLQQQAKEKLAANELAQKLASQKRATDAQQLLQGAFQPAQAAQPAPYIGGAPYGTATPAQPARFDLQAVIPQLMGSAEGRAALTDILNTQKALQPALTTLKPEENLGYMKDGQWVTVASGAPKVVKPDLASSFASAVDALGFPRKNASEYTEPERLAINKEMARQRAESKQSVTVTMPSEGERKAATLASRMNFSVGQMMQAIGTDPTAAKPDTIAEAARFLSQSEWLPNKLNSEQRQIVEAAQEDILDAALTLGTGAAYTREQLAGYKKSFFPQIGDTDATVKTKQARLQNLLETAQLAAGRAAKDIPSGIPQPGIANISLSDLIAEQQRRVRDK